MEMKESRSIDRAFEWLMVTMPWDLQSSADRPVTGLAAQKSVHQLRCCVKETKQQKHLRQPCEPLSIYCLLDLKEQCKGLCAPHRDLKPLSPP